MPFDANQNVVTNFTKVVHRKPYPTISVSRPELSQAGKTMLVTGGATGIGFGIVQSFIKAGAEKVIIVARREDVLKAAADDLKAQFGDASTIVTQTCDQTDRAAVRGLWAGFQSQGVFVDVLVLNAANFGDEGPLLETGADEV